MGLLDAIAVLRLASKPQRPSGAGRSSGAGNRRPEFGWLGSVLVLVLVLAFCQGSFLGCELMRLEMLRYVEM